MVVETFRYYAGAPERLLGDTIPVAGGVDMTFREPLGVVALIVPWNFPLTIASWKVGPALAAGNTIVLKPAELTPMTAIELERIAMEAGLPEGVLSVVVGPGRVVGERLIEHPDVAKVAFTGSTEVGRRIAEVAAGTIKRVTLELGGKSANLVSPTPTSSARRRRRRSPCSATRGRTAAPGPGSSSSARSSMRSWASSSDMCWHSASAIPSTSAPRWGHSSRAATATPWRRSWPTAHRLPSRATRPKARAIGFLPPSSVRSTIRTARPGRKFSDRLPA